MTSRDFDFSVVAFTKYGSLWIINDDDDEVRLSA